nr:serine/threonine-protein phosphatase 7 long form like [Quercus suber]
MHETELEDAETEVDEEVETEFEGTSKIGEDEDPGPLTCRGHAKEMANITMAPSREVDHCLISALVERWRPETHTFHLPHGEMSTTLQDVEVIFGLPIDGEVLVGSTAVVDGD